MAQTKQLSRRTAVVSALGTAALSGLGLGLADREEPGPTKGKEEAMVTAANLGQLKRIAHVVSPRGRHWVGDGFHVTTVFSPHEIDAQAVSPFVLMDHAAPSHFAPASTPRGVGPHPHRGFETVTFAYQGQVDHRDSHGGGGTIGAGDVQWMTAGSGVVHEEMHSAAFTREGGTFEMVQLWVNLPAALKMTPPRYQALPGATFPTFALGSATARLIAGAFEGRTGSAQTHSPITMFDLSFTEKGTSTFTLDEGATTLLFLMSGKARVQNERDVRQGEMVVADRESTGAIHIDAEPGTRVLVLSGAPLNEPVVAHGPFVMNTRQEIVQAISDYSRGKMGDLRPTT